MPEPQTDQPAGEPTIATPAATPAASPVASPPPSAWVSRWIGMPQGSARLLDFASGTGRHVRLALARGYRVLAVDRDRALLDMSESKHLEVRVEDLESGRWSFSAERFQVVVVTNFLFRPRLDLLPALLEPGGRLIYETFADGNAAYGKPSNPSFLLQPDELFLLARRAGLQVRAFEQGYTGSPKPALVQRLVAARLPAGVESLPLSGDHPEAASR